MRSSKRSFFNWLVVDIVIVLIFCLDGIRYTNVYIYIVLGQNFNGLYISMDG